MFVLASFGQPCKQTWGTNATEEVDKNECISATKEEVDENETGFISATEEEVDEITNERRSTR